MSSNEPAISWAEMLELFNAAHGYYDGNNDELQEALERMDLLHEPNRIESRNVAAYMKWCFSVSFLMMVNAWQWFMSGVLLARQSNLPAQVMQLYYYSTFFSYRSFLAAQFEGCFTVRIEARRRTDESQWKRERRRVRLQRSTYPPSIELSNPPKGDEHRSTASRFYEAFARWHLRGECPGVAQFVSNKCLLAHWRNVYTYQLGDMAEELFDDKGPCAPASDQLLHLWNADDHELANFYPEEYWALCHLKLAADLHLQLLAGYRNGTPYGAAQRRLIEGLYDQQERAGFLDFSTKVLGPMFQAR